jgi:hypothetical protein
MLSSQQFGFLNRWIGCVCRQDLTACLCELHDSFSSIGVAKIPSRFDIYYLHFVIVSSSCSYPLSLSPFTLIQSDALSPLTLSLSVPRHRKATSLSPFTGQALSEGLDRPPFRTDLTKAVTSASSGESVFMILHCDM